MDVGFFQFAPQLGKVEENLRRIRSALENLRADLIVLPELATSGYLFTSPKELAEVAEPATDGPTYRALAPLARRQDMAIVIGIPERTPEGIYNSALAILPDGSVHVYRKIHLFFEEKRLFRSGDRLVVFEFKGARIGMMICFDWAFPELARSLALMGADLLVHPANLILPYGQNAMRVRAVENRVFTITANRIGREERGGHMFTFTGGSQITDERGEILVQAGRKSEALFVVQIDPTRARDKRLNPYNDLFKDRRPEIYHLR